MDHNSLKTSQLELARQLEAMAARLNADAQALRRTVEESPPPEKTPLEPQSLLDVKALGELLGLSRSSIYTLRQERNGPPFVRLGNRVRYRPKDVRIWLDGLASNN